MKVSLLNKNWYPWKKFIQIMTHFLLICFVVLQCYWQIWHIFLSCLLWECCFLDKFPIPFVLWYGPIDIYRWRIILIFFYYLCCCSNLLLVYIAHLFLSLVSLGTVSLTGMQHILVNTCIVWIRSRWHMRHIFL